MEEIKKVLDSEVGSQLKEFLTKKLNELRDIRNIKRFKTEKAQIIELDSQQKAYDKLWEILNEIITIESFSETPKEENEFGKLY